MAQSFPKQYRLLKPKEFQALKTGSFKVANQSLTIFYKKNNLGHARLGIVVAKKQIYKACDRNRLKRIIRETFRTMHELLASNDYVVIVKAEALIEHSVSFYEEIKSLWLKCINLQNKEKR